MKSPLQIWRDHQARRKQQAESDQLLQTMGKIAVVFETLDLFEQHSLLHVTKPTTSRGTMQATVTIASLLAHRYMYVDADWQQFLHNLTAWARYSISQHHYNQLYVQAMADAEVAALRQKQIDGGPDALSVDERHAARMEAMVAFDARHADEGALPISLQFVVLGLSDGEPILVARYDADTDTFVTNPVPDRDTSEEEE